MDSRVVQNSRNGIRVKGGRLSRPDSMVREKQPDVNGCLTRVTKMRRKKGEGYRKEIRSSVTRKILPNTKTGILVKLTKSKMTLTLSLKNYWMVRNGLGR